MEVLILLWLVVGIPCIVISFLKGNWIYALLGVLVTVLAIIGAVLPAKPNSYWARKIANGA